MSWLFHMLLFLFIGPSGKSDEDRQRQLLLEIVALRHQLSVLQRKVPKARFAAGDRWLWAWISSWWIGWKRACILVKPETVIRWHRLGFKVFWKWKSSRNPGGKRTQAEVVALIRRMASENRTWGSPRIHGELLKLGFRVSERTVLRYMPKRKGTDKQRQAWRTFLENHREVIAAMDFLVVPTINFHQIYILVILHHGRRMIAHVNITTNPTAEWVKQQLREAFPFDEIPKYLIFDNDTTFGAVKSFVESMGISPKQTAFHCPWQNGAVERFNGTLRRELLDHVIVLNEAHLRRLLKHFLAYYHEDRTHLTLSKDAPKGRAEEIPPNPGAAVEAMPRLGGIHHRYHWENAA